MDKAQRPRSVVVTGAARGIGQRDVGSALRHAQHAATAFAGQPVALRRPHIVQRQVAGEGRFDQAEIDGDLDFQAVLAGPFDPAAARNRCLERLGVVEGGPDAIARGRKDVVSAEIQNPRPLLICRTSVRLFRTICGKIGEGYGPINCHALARG